MRPSPYEIAAPPCVALVMASAAAAWNFSRLSAPCCFFHVVSADQVNDEKHRLDASGQHRIDDCVELRTEVIHQLKYRPIAMCT